LRPKSAGLVAEREMTINVALATSDAVVLGCDSIASVTGYFLDPTDLPWVEGPDGKPIKDADGKFSDEPVLAGC
jgi:hypothetical protein